MTKQYKSTNKCLTLSIHIKNPAITKAKDYLTKKYKNIYDINPHITITTTPIPEKNLDKVKKELESYFKNIKCFNLKLTQLNLDSKNRFFSIEVSGTKIKKIHEELTLLINKFRDGYVRGKDKWRLEKGLYELKQVKNIEKYGFYITMDLFHPHVTIGRVADKQADLKKVHKQLEQLLKDVLDTQYKVIKILALYYVDTVVQSDIKVIWQKYYPLR